MNEATYTPPHPESSPVAQEQAQPQSAAVQEAAPAGQEPAPPGQLSGFLQDRAAANGYPQVGGSGSEQSMQPPSEAESESVSGEPPAQESATPGSRGVDLQRKLAERAARKAAETQAFKDWFDQEKQESAQAEPAEAEEEEDEAAANERLTQDTLQKQNFARARFAVIEDAAAEFGRLAQDPNAREDLKSWNDFLQEKAQEWLAKQQDMIEDLPDGVKEATNEQELAEAEIAAGATPEVAWGKVNTVKDKFKALGFELFKTAKDGVDYSNVSDTLTALFGRSSDGRSNTGSSSGSREGLGQEVVSLSQFRDLLKQSPKQFAEKFGEVYKKITETTGDLYLTDQIQLALKGDIPAVIKILVKLDEQLSSKQPDQANRNWAAISTQLGGTLVSRPGATLSSDIKTYLYEQSKQNFGEQFKDVFQNRLSTTDAKPEAEQPAPVEQVAVAA